MATTRRRSWGHCSPHSGVVALHRGRIEARIYARTLAQVGITAGDQTLFPGSSNARGRGFLPPTNTPIKGEFTAAGSGEMGVVMLGPAVPWGFFGSILHRNAHSRP